MTPTTHWSTGNRASDLDLGRLRIRWKISETPDLFWMSNTDCRWSTMGNEIYWSGSSWYLAISTPRRSNLIFPPGNLGAYLWSDNRWRTGDSYSCISDIQSHTIDSAALSLASLTGISNYFEPPRIFWLHTALLISIPQPFLRRNSLSILLFVGVRMTVISRSAQTTRVFSKCYNIYLFSRHHFSAQPILHSFIDADRAHSRGWTNGNASLKSFLTSEHINWLKNSLNERDAYSKRITHSRVCENQSEKLDDENQNWFVTLIRRIVLHFYWSTPINTPSIWQRISRLSSIVITNGNCFFTFISLLIEGEEKKKKNRNVEYWVTSNKIPCIALPLISRFRVSVFFIRLPMNSL